MQTHESILDLMFVGNQIYCFTSGRGIFHSEKMLEIMACVTPCKDKSIIDLIPDLKANIKQFSGSICIFLSWTKAHQKIVKKRVRLNDLKDGSKQKDNIFRDDAFLKFEKSMSQKGFARHPFETWVSWFQRIESQLEAKESNAYLEKIQNLYYRHRFSKNGLTTDQKTDTDTRLKTFLNTLK